MRSTSRDGSGGMAQGSGKYRRKKGVAYSKFEEDFQASLMIAAGQKGRETLDPSKMKHNSEVYNTLEQAQANMSIESTRDQINMSQLSMTMNIKSPLT